MQPRQIPVLGTSSTNFSVTATGRVARCSAEQTFSQLQVLTIRIDVSDYFLYSTPSAKLLCRACFDTSPFYPCQGFFFDLSTFCISALIVSDIPCPPRKVPYGCAAVASSGPILALRSARRKVCHRFHLRLPSGFS